MEETEREEIFHGQGSVSKVIFRSDGSGRSGSGELSLLAGILLLAAQVGFIGVPAVAFCAALLLDASMAMIHLNTYRTGLEEPVCLKNRGRLYVNSAAWRGCICGSSCGR